MNLYMARKRLDFMIVKLRCAAWCTFFSVFVFLYLDYGLFAIQIRRLRRPRRLWLVVPLQNANVVWNGSATIARLWTTTPTSSAVRADTRRGNSNWSVCACPRQAPLSLRNSPRPSLGPAAKGQQVRTDRISFSFSFSAQKKMMVYGDFVVIFVFFRT